MQTENREDPFQEEIQWWNRSKGKLCETITEHIIALNNVGFFFFPEFHFGGVGLDAAKWCHKTFDYIYV